METSSAPHRLTRCELYDRVWSTPVIRLAEQFGLTNFLLTGICRKHQIPTPPAGYWSKVAHDKATARPLLAGDAETIVDIGKAKTPGYRASKPAARRKVHAPADAPTEPLKPAARVTGPSSKITKTLTRLRAGKGDGCCQFNANLSPLRAA
jgi:hypothetical protein